MGQMMRRIVLFAAFAVFSTGLGTMRGAAEEGLPTPRPNLFERETTVAPSLGVAQTSNLTPRAARAVFRAATTQSARFEAARAVAAAYARDGQVLRAQWWLRRAANFAPSRAEADLNRADFQVLRARTRLRPSLSFTVTPTDNINDGADSQVLDLDGIILLVPTSALALSGIEYTGDVRLDYRLSETASHRTTLSGAAFARTYTLSGQAKRRAPQATGSDFSLAQVTLGIDHERRIAGWPGPVDASLRIGRVWSGGTKLRRFLQVGAGQTLPFGPTRVARLSAYYEWHFPDRETEPAATVAGLQGRYRYTWPGRGQLTLLGKLDRYRADSATASFDTARARADYTFARPVLGTGVTLFADATWRDYDEFSISLDGRRDRGVALGTTLVFQEVTAFGFAPTLTLSAERQRSNVDLFNTSGLAISAGFTSQF